MESLKEAVARNIDELRDRLLALSHEIHAFAEVGFDERRSSAAVSSVLRGAAFEFTTVDSLPTAFVARKGTGALNVGICVEYDALPGVGHACGHNVIAAAGVGAALALANIADSLGITVTVLGTPAEEGGGGKILMLQKGAFDGLHAAMMVHASRIERDAMPTLAVSQLTVEFHGVAAHAAASPERGRSAAAAMALAQSGIGMLREHLLASDRVHGIVTKGGDAPNIVPSHTRGRWFVRAATSERLRELEPSVVDVFKGAALMTGCRLEISKEAPVYTELRTDQRLAKLWRTNAATLGRDSTPVQPDDGPASTDMGNVSYAMPSIHPFIAIESNGANIHELSFREAAASESADRAVIDGATAMAWTVVDVAGDLALREELQRHPYRVADVPLTDRSYLDEAYDATLTFP